MERLISVRAWENICFPFFFISQGMIKKDADFCHRNRKNKE